MKQSKAPAPSQGIFGLFPLHIALDLGDTSNDLAAAKRAAKEKPIDRDYLKEQISESKDIFYDYEPNLHALDADQFSRSERTQFERLLKDAAKIRSNITETIALCRATLKGTAQTPKPRKAVSAIVKSPVAKRKKRS